MVCGICNGLNNLGCDVTTCVCVETTCLCVLSYVCMWGNVMTLYVGQCDDAVCGAMWWRCMWGNVMTLYVGQCDDVVCGAMW